MCELLGMSANVPTDIKFSFTGLIERGGRTGPHRDGWGIAFYADRGCRCFHDPLPGAHSEVADLIRRYAIKSRTVLCHIRRANRGRVCLENTHHGKALPMAYLERARDFTRERGLKLHLDGARVFNAAVKHQVDIAEIARPFDSVQLGADDARS